MTTPKWSAAIAVCALALGLGPHGLPEARGAAPGGDVELEIPKAPSAPPKLLAPKGVEGFGCDRFFTYKGRNLTCDSIVRQDAESLRSVVKDVPDAVAELDTYQLNRERVKSYAYLGSAGLLIALIGFVLGEAKIGPNPVTTRLVGVTGGLSLTVGSFIFGSYLLRSNEGHINTAVNDFNSVHPGSPIVLQFSTGLAF